MVETLIETINPLAEDTNINNEMRNYLDKAIIVNSFTFIKLNESEHIGGKNFYGVFSLSLSGISNLVNVFLKEWINHINKNYYDEYDLSNEFCVRLSYGFHPSPVLGRDKLYLEGTKKKLIKS